MAIDTGTWRPTSLVRPREVARAVTPLELFLTSLVFTVSQLAHHLLGDVDARGMAETLVLTLAVMYAWFMTVWTTNWLDADRRPVRLLLLCLMFASLVMSTSVSEAFGIAPASSSSVTLRFRSAAPHSRSSPSAITVCTRTSLTPWPGRSARRHSGSPGSRPAAMAGCPLGGRDADHLRRRDRRPSLPGRKSPFSSDSEIYAEHLLERFRLFFLIALGETVLTLGNAFADQPVEADRLLVLAVAFTGSVALWWCYFHRARDWREGGAGARRPGAHRRPRQLHPDPDGDRDHRDRRRRRAGDRRADGRPSSPSPCCSSAARRSSSLPSSASCEGRPVMFPVESHRLRGTAVLAIATAPLSLLAAVVAATGVLVAVAISDTRSDAAPEPSPAARLCSSPAPWRSGYAAACKAFGFSPIFYLYRAKIRRIRRFRPESDQAGITHDHALFRQVLAVTAN